METLAEDNAVLLAENVGETSDGAHQNSHIEETSVEINSVEENQTFGNTDIIAESDGTNLENSLSDQQADSSANIEGNIEEVLENRVIEETHTIEPSVTEGNQQSEEIAESVETADNVTTEENRNISTDIVSEDVEMKNEPPQPQNIQEQSTEVEGSDYNSEYMLEHHTENVYMPENIVEDNVVASGQVYSTELISDDSQEVLYDKEPQPPKPSEAEQLPGEHENFISEYELEQNTEMQSRQQVNDVEIIDKSQNVKDDYENLNTDVVESNENDKTNSVELENQITVIEESNDAQLSDSLQKKGDANEVIRKETETVCIEERASGNHLSEKDNENIGEFNREVVQNIELQNDSSQTISSRTTLVPDFTISEEMEVGQIEDGEYTIVEGPTSLNMTATHASGSNSEGTLLLLQSYDNPEAEEIIYEAEEEQEIYLTEVPIESEVQESSSNQSPETKPIRKGRKPTYEIPMHVLGHDINKPVENVVNGRPVPRPRLGVKVPYRNLTSQIVTKAEIEKEIMERVRIKQEQVAKGDVLFARKLTQRLARKIAPSPDPPRRFAAAVKAGAPSTQPERKSVEVAEVTISVEPQALNKPEVAQENTKIQNDSDLIAILEGEGEEMPVLPKEISQPQDDDSNLKMLEREIALQQLSDLPNQAPKQRIYNRGRHFKAPTLTAEVSSNKDSSTDTSASQSSGTITQKTSQPLKSPNKENTGSKETVHVSSKKDHGPKENVHVSPKKDHNSKETVHVSRKKDQSNLDVSSPSKKHQLVEIEPQVKVNMVLKTYSRKRNFPEASSNSPPPKKPFLEDSEVKIEKSEPTGTPDVYITKSSRVIKKKVIWDPDEVPSRSPKPSTKSDLQPSIKAAPARTVKSTEKTVHTEKVPEKKPTTEKSAQEKVVDKKTPEKGTFKKVIKEKTTTSSEKKASKNKTPVKAKKGLSEVDRLLMDEGAVKMLYDLKNADETVVRKKKDVYSVDRAHKEIIKKANELKNDLLEQNTSNESPKTLRKKEGFSPSPSKLLQISGISERKMSKDSTRSSVHTPPGSPAYSFAHSQSSMLIRRRSSSSISSSEEIDDSDSVKVVKKKPSTTQSYAPKAKKVKKSDNSKETTEQAISKTESPSKVVKSVSDQKLQYKTFTVKKLHKHINIDLNYSNKKCYCTLQVLEELTAALNKFAKEKDCLVVSITASSKAFCLGLDYASLLSEKEELQKKNATELAKHVREFLVCLLHFPKVLVAGIQGDCVGLGVTMLPLFDMVIASDTATFSTPYASLGCVAEAGFLLTLPNLINHGLAAELLYTTQKLTADDAFRRGLISRLCWPEKYNETFKNFLSSISKSSKQSLEATKKQLRSHIVQTTEAAINSETKVLIDHWTSPECQKSFAQLESGI